MRRTSLLLVLAVVVGGAFISGCQGLSRPDVTPVAPPPTPLVRAGSADNGLEQAQPAADLASRFPLPAPAPEAESAGFDDSQCVACHTDETAVQALAVEPEKEEQLSEGEG
jgi:hypothetical protein